MLIINSYRKINKLACTQHALPNLFQYASDIYILTTENGAHCHNISDKVLIEGSDKSNFELMDGKTLPSLVCC